MVYCTRSEQQPKRASQDPLLYWHGMVGGDLALELIQPWLCFYRKGFVAAQDVICTLKKPLLCRLMTVVIVYTYIYYTFLIVLNFTCSNIMKHGINQPFASPSWVASVPQYIGVPQMVHWCATGIWETRAGSAAGHIIGHKN